MKNTEPAPARGPPPVISSAPPPVKIYSVPRRYDLATMFVVSVAYALLFAIVLALGAGPATFALVAGFFTFVGLAQALLFRGKQPRMSSILAGMAYYFIASALSMTVWWWNDIWQHPEVIIIALASGLCTSVFGAVCGYLAGTMIGGVFLVGYRLRRRIAGRAAE